MEEVHFWRGSAEQQALRSQLARSGQFDYFDCQLDHPDWTNKTVLDFGGNAGYLLQDANCTIQPQNYYCIDVLREALAEGARQFPQAHWIHYNRYNCSFNPDGIPDLMLPNAGTEFDLILAYSVFTHTTRDEMNDLVHQLQTRLKPDGVLAFTFIDPHFNSWPDTYDGTNLRWRLEKFRRSNSSLDVDRLIEQTNEASWCALVDGCNVFINSSGAWNDETQTCITYHVYYTVGFLRQEFPSAIIRTPVNDEMQHCCILSKTQH